MQTYAIDFTSRIVCRIQGFLRKEEEGAKQTPGAEGRSVERKKSLSLISVPDCVNLKIQMRQKVAHTSTSHDS